MLELLAGEDKEIQDLVKQISELRDKMEELETKIREKIEPVAEEVVNEKAEDLDDREDFPYEWLEEQIVEGRTYLDHGDYTDPSDMKEGLVNLVRDQLVDQEYGGD